MTKHVTVLMGGWSAEREISMVSGAAVAKSLIDAGLEVTPVDVQRDMGALLTRLYPRPDAVFNALQPTPAAAVKLDDPALWVLDAVRQAQGIQVDAPPGAVSLQNR